MSRDQRVDRRSFLSALVPAGAAILGGYHQAAATDGEIRFGLTPVFLNNDLEILARLKAFLERQSRLPVSLVQRRTYEEITSLLVSGQLTAAWICGYPFIQYRRELELLAVPIWNGRRLYQSYLIASESRQASALSDLRGDIHAFSDPNSNSGFLITSAELARIGLRPESFFQKTFFTYSHRNVVRAVAAGLADSGSVDGYVWEVLSETEPELTARTRVVARSEWLGFPPIAALRRQSDAPEVQAVSRALRNMATDSDGAAVLALLRLDGFAPARAELFDGIAERVEQVRRLG